MLPLNDGYKPDVIKWVCSCPSFTTSRFVLCKHLVQGVHHVPIIFFLEVKSRRMMLFWRHQTLKPLGGEVAMSMVESNNCRGGDEGSDDEFDEDFMDTQWGDRGGHTFEKAMNNHISTILQFIEGLRY